MKKEEREALQREKLLIMRQYEEELYEKGKIYIAGVDEVGRGPLAGPVVAAAVVLPRDFDVPGIDDSKKLSEKKREYFYEIIRQKAIAWGIGMADHQRIDEINILQATKEAMGEAIGNVQKTLQEHDGAQLEHVLLDALTLEAINLPQTGIVKGDSKCISIAAASILAKVTRDRMMVEWNEVYPGYAFDKNKGYGTKAHYEGLHAQGICPIHRRTFLKNFKRENREKC